MAKGSREVQKRIDAIRRDREHGASYLAQEAVRTLALAAAATPRGRDPWEYVGEVAQALSSARPSMAPLEVALARVLEQARRDGGGPGAIQAAAQHVSERLASAAEEAARRAAALLPQRGVVVLTCSYSATVARTLLLLHGQGRLRRVMAVSPSRGEVDHGARLAEELRARSLAAGVFPLAALDEAVEMAQAVLVGADRVLPDGSFVNGSPTLRLAQAAQGRIPLYVVCDTFKLAPDAVSPEQGMDLVPAHLVTDIVTEEG